MRAGPKGSYHGKSIKNGATYEALRRKYGKSRAAAISNGVLNKGYRRGRHHRK